MFVESGEVLSYVTTAQEDAVQLFASQGEYIGELPLTPAIEVLSLSPAGHVVVIPPGAAIRAYDQKGRPLWRDSVAAAGEPSFGRDGRIAVLQAEGRSLRLLSAGGRLIRQVLLPGDARSSPVTDRADKTYLIAGETLLALNADGLVLARYPVPRDNTVSPVAIVAPGRLALAVGRELWCLGDSRQ